MGSKFLLVYVLVYRYCFYVEYFLELCVQVYLLHPGTWIEIEGVWSIVKTWLSEIAIY